jgi:hypothetical protein
MTVLTHKTLLLGLALISLVACDGGQPVAKRTVGSSINGLWYQPAYDDSCTSKAGIYNIGEKTINIQGPATDLSYAEYEQLQRTKQAEIRVRLRFIDTDTTKIVVRLADDGANLKFIGLEDENGNLVPDKSYPKETGMLNLTRCSEPTFWGSFKLAIGWDAAYDPNLARKLITPKDLPKN